MSDSDEPTLPQPTASWDLGIDPQPSEPATRPMPPVDLAATPPEDGDWEWPSRATQSGVRLRVPTLILLGLLLAAGGLWGGAALQRSHSPTTSTASAASFFRSSFGSGSFPGRTFSGGGALGGAGSAAAGTVTVIEGNVIYLTTATGSIEKVTVSSSTVVTQTAKSEISALRPGDVVVVQGAKQSDGTVKASSISATQASVSSGLGG